MDAKTYLAFLASSLEPSASELASFAPQLREWGAFRSRQVSDPGVRDLYDGLAVNSPAVFQTAFVNEQLLPPLLSGLPPDLRTKVESVPVGVLPLRTVNACAAKAPNGEPFIILDSGLFSMSSFFHETQVVVASIMKEQGFEEATRHHERAYRFILSYYDQAGNMSFPRFNVDRKLPFDHLAFAVLKALAGEFFVLAHEIGHIIAGHLDGDTPTRAVAMNGDSELLTIFNKSQQQELQADAIGFHLYQHACHSITALSVFRPPLRRVVPLEFFQLPALVEANVKRPDRYATHPPTRLRVSNLLMQLKEKQVDEEEFQLAVGIAKIVLTMPTLDM